MLISLLWYFFLSGFLVIAPANVIVSLWHKKKKGSTFPNRLFAVVFFLQLFLSLFVLFVMAASQGNLIGFSEYFLKGLRVYNIAAMFLSSAYFVLQCYYFFLWEKQVKV